MRQAPYGQAQRRALGTRAPVAGTGPYTVNDALDDYLRYLEGDGRARHSLRSTRSRAEQLIRPRLGAAMVADLNGALVASRGRARFPNAVTESEVRR